MLHDILIAFSTSSNIIFLTQAYVEAQKLLVERCVARRFILTELTILADSI